MGRILATLLLVAGACLTGAAQSATIQSVGVRNFDLRAVVSSPTRASLHGVRTIRDPHTRICWQLRPNAAAPAGPAQMSPAADRDGSCAGITGDQDAQKFVIHRGDRVVVEEHTRAVDARLESVAMGPAMVGSALDLKLTIGRNVVRAVAIAPGRAALVPATEVGR